MHDRAVRRPGRRRRGSGSRWASSSTSGNWLAWLVKVSIIVITFLLGIELAVIRA